VEQKHPEIILLCDDDDSMRRVVFAVLTRHGYQVLAAQNGRQALEVAEAYGGPIHLLLTDVLMPELDGPGLAKQLLVVRPGVRVIFMSAFSDGMLASLDGWAFLQKPFAPSALLKAVGDSGGATADATACP
jgi:two-component system cell cycle sensor histidine kinase/response regulator CckA